MWNVISGGDPRNASMCSLLHCKCCPELGRRIRGDVWAVGVTVHVDLAKDSVTVPSPLPNYFSFNNTKLIMLRELLARWGLAIFFDVHSRISILHSDLLINRRTLSIPTNSLGTASGPRPSIPPSRTTIPAFHRYNRYKICIEIHSGISEIPRFEAIQYSLSISDTADMTSLDGQDHSAGTSVVTERCRRPRQV